MQKSLNLFLTPTNSTELYYKLKQEGRLKAQRGAVLGLLIDYGLHHVGEVQRAGGLQYNARIYELRKLGFKITSLKGENETFFKLER